METAIKNMLDRMVPGDGHQLVFEVGKFGRCDRFVLRHVAPYQSVEAGDFQSQPGNETLTILEALDDLIEIDGSFSILFNAHPKNSYCWWCRMVDRKEWAMAPKVAPLYIRRMQEQQRISDGTLKRGHKDFGFFPMQGFG